MKTSFRTRVALAATGLGVVLSAPAFAQEADDSAATAGDIIVTAQRFEQRLQDVPISMTVFNQAQISDRNVTTVTDLATYTPSLSVNSRYGPEKATFAIRGFNQDQSTAPTVGVYFADVVGVRAQGGTSGGNTVGAGTFTDLQNVQVLKGPQGTLFGRNTTGGAVLLVPQKPTDNLEGYVEGQIGNYDARRIQAALNIPLADTFKIRLSVDRNKRDGYMKNHSGIGPDDYNDVDYFYGRLSIVANLTPDLENYTIFHYSRSHSNGFAARIFGCDNSATGSLGPLLASGRLNAKTINAGAACDQIARQNARGDGPLDVEVNNPDPFLNIDTFQFINTTTWTMSDTLTLKNIVSYGEFKERTSFSLNSDNFFIPARFNDPTTLPLGVQPGARYQYILLDVAPNEDNAAQSTFTEELQLQGHTEKLDFVVGGYLEFSRPMGWSAGYTAINGFCTDAENLVCAYPQGSTIISASHTKINFDNNGIFGQATYHFNDQLALTVGGRYTFDKITGESDGNRIILLPNGARLLQCNDPRANNRVAPTIRQQCLVKTGDTFPATPGLPASAIATPKSNRPTWVINLEYKPNSDLMMYAKWSRGYRQGGLNFTNPTLETWDPEKVEAYEVGAKVTFGGGGVRGYFNVAGFYNDFTNQQIFGSLIAKPTSGLAGGAAIINAGKSRLYGIEADTSITLWDAFRIDAGYTYLNTKIKELVAPTLSADSPFSNIFPNGQVGDPLALSPKHKATISGTYTLPLDESMGKLTAGASFIYQSKSIANTSERASTIAVLGYDAGALPAQSLININLNWTDAGGLPIDVGAFITNVENKHYRVQIGQGWISAGFENASYNLPRMYGLRIKYKFGN
jgi:iron complex outermembrane receptor protein